MYNAITLPVACVCLIWSEGREILGATHVAKVQHERPPVAMGSSVVELVYQLKKVTALYGADTLHLQQLHSPKKKLRHKYNFHAHKVISCHHAHRVTMVHLFRVIQDLPSVFYPAWNLGSLSCNTSYVRVCVCLSVYSLQKPSKQMHLCGAYSCSFIQLRTSKCTRLEGQWRCSYCHFHSSCLKSLWQGHKFLCHEARREHSCDVRFPTWLLKWHGRASFNRAMNVGIMPRTTAVVASKPGHAQHGRKPRPWATEFMHYTRPQNSRCREWNVHVDSCFVAPTLVWQAALHFISFNFFSPSVFDEMPSVFDKMYNRSGNCVKNVKNF